MGRDFKGVYHFYEDAVYLYEPGKNAIQQEGTKIVGLNNPELIDNFSNNRNVMKISRNEVKSVNKALDLEPDSFMSLINDYYVEKD